MKISNEAKIGVLVVIVLAILGALTWKAGNFDFNPKGYELKARFHNIEGVELNSPVTVNGFEVGRVTDIKIVYGEKTFVELTLWLDQEAKIHKGAVALVKQMGFLGEKYIGLTTGNDSEPFLMSGAMIEGKEPANMERMLAQGEDIAKNLKEISEQVNERLKVNSEAIDSIFADLKTSMSNIASISGNVKERLDVNKATIDEIVMHLNATSENLEEMSADLKINPWKLMYKPRKTDKIEK